MNRVRTSPDWTSNPSAWRKRIPAAFLALAGLSIAIYLTLFQYGVLDSIWDPFFDGGSRRVLTSSVSTTIERYTQLPIKDAALGALAYLLELVADLLGGGQRWRTAPWAVAIFAGISASLGCAAVALVLMQAVVVRAWCTLCLASATVSLALVAVAIHEAWATLAYLLQQHALGRSWWRTFWNLAEV